MIPSFTTPLVFFRAVGDAKMAQLVAAAQTDPIVGLLLLKATAADRIRRDDPELREGLETLRDKGLLTNQEITNLIG